jgi:hypothetical protein
MVGLYNSFSYSFNSRLCTIRQYIPATNDGRRLSHWLASVAAVAANAVPAPGAAILERSRITRTKVKYGVRSSKFIWAPV